MQNVRSPSFEEVKCAVRAAIVAEARTWLGTTFSMNAAIKHVGADCGRMPFAVYSAVGCVALPTMPPHWPRDFMCHRMGDAEPYADLVASVFQEITEDQLQPGDLVLFREGRCFSHAAIVTDWPTVIHARGKGTHPCVEESSARAYPLAGHAMRFFGIALRAPAHTRALDEAVTVGVTARPDVECAGARRTS